MNKIKTFIIITIIAIIIIIIVILNKSINDNKTNIALENEVKEILNSENKVKRVDNISDYLTAKECIDSYIAFSRDLYYLQDIEDINNEYEYINKQMLSIIPDFVLNELNINTDNLYQFVEIPGNIYRIEDMYASKQSLDVDFEADIIAYIVKGTFINENNIENNKKFELIVLADNIRKTFYIIPPKYFENKNINIKIGDNFNIYTKNEIENNQYNTFMQKVYTNQDMAKEYLNIYRISMQYDPEYMYNKLDDEYKQKRFGTYEEFKKYVNKNRTRIATEQLSKFKVNNYDDYKEYILIDKNENYYIIKETAIGEYSLILDTYTIDLPEYVDKYNQANERQKIANCINRFIKILNDENYRLSYELLADSFKSNYFKTQQEFEKYAKQNLLGKEKLSFYEYKNEGDMYSTYNVELSSTEDENNKINKTFVVKLNEGTDFELSFNVN